MKIASLNKEQKQHMVLGGLVGGIALFSLFAFVLVPMKKNWSMASGEVGTLQTQVAEGERLIGNRTQLLASLEASGATMNEASGQYLPDPANPLAWATRALYAVGRDIGLDIQAVSEVGPSQILRTQSEKGSRKFGVYAVRVEAQCGYEMLKQFLLALEESNPYICVSGISLIRNTNTPEQHGMNLTLEWPAWTEASQKAGPQTLKGV